MGKSFQIVQIASFLLKFQFIHLFICISMDSWISKFFQWIIIHYSHCLFHSLTEIFWHNKLYIFKMYNLIILTYAYTYESITIIKLVKHIHHPQKLWFPLIILVPSLHIPPISKRQPLICFLYSLEFCRVLYKWNHMFLLPSLFPSTQFFWDPSCSYMYQQFILFFSYWVVFHRINTLISQFLYLFISWYTFGLFPVLKYK